MPDPSLSRSAAWLTGVSPVLDALPTAILLLTPDLGLVWSNRSARHLLAKRPELHLQKQTLVARRKSEQAALEAVVTDARAGGKPRLVAFHNRQGRPTLAMTVRPAGADGLLLALPVSLTPAAPAASAALTDLLRLTPAEARLAEALLAGDGVAEAADRLGISVLTVRSGVRTLFAKTGAVGLARLSGFLVRLAQLEL